MSTQSAPTPEQDPEESTTLVESDLRELDEPIPASQQISYSGSDFDVEGLVWAAAGFMDTLLRWKMKPEVVYGNEKAIQPGVQA
jgi:hypothetical protein